jgi:hypothetical protein
MAYLTDSEVFTLNDAPRDGKAYSRMTGKWVAVSSDYENLSNKPAIDGTVLTKDSTAAGLGLETAADAEAMEERIDEALTAETEAREEYDEEQDKALAAETAAREAHDEEQDAKIQTLNGAYYVLDAYDFGKTLDETDPDDIALLNTYAIANTPGATSMADVYNDTVIINEFDTSEFVYNKISELWVKYPNGYLTIATNDHLGVIKGTLPPADPADRTKDTYVQVLADGTMKLIGNLPPFVPPLWFQYTQYATAASNDYDTAFPEKSRPETIWPGTLWRALWEDEQVFFRTGGSLGSQSDRTNGKQNQASQLPSHNHSLPGHTHSIPSHTHGFNYNTPGAAPVGLDGGGAILYVFSGVDDARSGTTNSGGSGTSGSGGSGTSGNTSDSTETRPVNRLMIIWERYG